MTQPRGIRTIADIRDRCRIDEETGCWEWRGAVASGRAGSNPVPVCWFPTQDRIMTVPRVSWLLCRKPLGSKHLVWRHCLNDRCVNPKHLMAGTRAEWGAWTAAQGHLKGNPTKVATSRQARLARGTSLTMELAQWARESQQSGRAAAHGLMCSEQVVSRVRRGETWVPVMASASVFALGQAVNAARLRRQA